MVVPILKLREGLLQAQKPEADAFRDTGIQFFSVTTAPEPILREIAAHGV
jgi:hypothetical protein